MQTECSRKIVPGFFVCFHCLSLPLSVWGLQRCWHPDNLYWEVTNQELDSISNPQGSRSWVNTLFALGESEWSCSCGLRYHSPLQIWMCGVQSRNSAYENKVVIEMSSRTLHLIESGLRWSFARWEMSSNTGAESVNGLMSIDNANKMTQHTVFYNSGSQKPIFQKKTPKKQKKKLKYQQYFP